jgi:hypothetical protein
MFIVEQLWMHLTVEVIISNLLQEYGFQMRMACIVRAVIIYHSLGSNSSDHMIKNGHHLMPLKQWVCGFTFPLGLGCLHFVLSCDSNALQWSDARNCIVYLDNDLQMPWPKLWCNTEEEGPLYSRVCLFVSFLNGLFPIKLLACRKWMTGYDGYLISTFS